jgi:non-specific serine/threonine protein kinase
MQLHTEAAELFCDRARLARNDVEVLPTDAAVLSICRQLDGLPLAIELAASAVAALEPAEIAVRIGEQLLRTESSAPSVGRHRSLRASMEWSHDLLSPRARVLFRRLAAFPSTFSLDAVELVCSGDGLDRRDVLGVLTELVQASLVGRETQPGSTDSTRYGLLQTVRAFAAGLLEGSGEHQRIQAQHAAMTLALAEAARRNVLGPDEIEWRDKLDLARHDLRTALEYTRRHDPALGVRIALAVWPHWLVWGRFDEGLAHLRTLLGVQSESTTGLRAWTLTAAADLASDAGEARQATAWAEEALALFAVNESARGEAYALRALANAHYNRGHFDRAVELVQAAALRFERLDDGIGLIHVTYLLGFVHTRLGNLDEAERAFWRALRWCTETGSRLARARSLWILGSVAQERGDYEAAQDLCERSLGGLIELADTVSIARVQVILGDIARLRRETQRATRLYERATITLREAGDLGGLASAKFALAEIAADAGQLDRSSALYLEAVNLRNSLGDDAGLVPCLRGLAAIQRLLGQPEFAVTLLAAAENVLSRTSPAAGESPEDVAVLDELHAELDPRTFAAAWTAGEDLSAEEICLAHQTVPAQRSSIWTMVPDRLTT